MMLQREPSACVRPRAKQERWGMPLSPGPCAPCLPVALPVVVAGAFALALAPRAARAEGFLDAVTCETGMKGWAAAPGDKETAIDVTFTFDAVSGEPGTVLHPYLESLAREDLCADHGCDHGFLVTLPLSLHDGADHVVHAYTTVAGVEAELASSPKTFSCPLVLPSGVKRKISDTTAFGAWRFSTFWDAISVSDGILASYTDGAPLADVPRVVHSASAPDAIFLIDVTAKKSKVKRAFTDGPAQIAWNVSPMYTEEVPDAELAGFAASAPMRARPFVLRGAGDTYFLVDDDVKAGTTMSTGSGEGGGPVADGGPGDPDNGCGCSTVGSDEQRGAAGVAAVALASALLARSRRARRARAATIGAAGAMLVALVGCDTKQTTVRIAESSATVAPTSSAPVVSTQTGWDFSSDPMRKSECVPGKGKDYEVGPGKKIEHLIDVPWESIGAGDTVRIHPKKGGYHEKILISQAGSAAEPLRICGVPGPGGELPVIDGENAKTRAGGSIDYTYEPQQDRGLIIVSLDKKDRYGFKPNHLLIENLELKHAHPDYSFTGSAGDARRYLDNAAGLYIERGEDIIVRGCIIDDNANGFFLASGDDEATLSRRVSFERNYVYGNGTVGAKFDRHHNIYAEAIGMIFQFNRVGPLRKGSGGSALKDRSAGTIVRYNWIEGGSRSLDLVEAEESWQNQKTVPEHNDAWVYGNVILATPEGASSVVHFGGDNGFEDTYRNGTLYFYDNTVVIRADQTKRWRTALFELATNRQTVDARNNVVFVTSDTEGAEPTSFTLMNQSGTGVFDRNLMSASADFSDGSEVKGKVSGVDKIARLGKGESPFKVWGREPDLHLVDAAAAKGTPVELAKGALPLDFEYVPHQSGKPRKAKAVGAFE